MPNPLRPTSTRMPIIDFEVNDHKDPNFKATIIVHHRMHQNWPSTLFQSNRMSGILYIAMIIYIYLVPRTCITSGHYTPLHPLFVAIYIDNLSSFHKIATLTFEEEVVCNNRFNSNLTFISQTMLSDTNLIEVLGKHPWHDKQGKNL